MTRFTCGNFEVHVHVHCTVAYSDVSLSSVVQANCYCMALTALSLTPTKYAWVVRPVELEEVSGEGGRREGEGGKECSSHKEAVKARREGEPHCL